MSEPKTIESNQNGIHDNLEMVVKRHLHSRFQRPFPDYSIAAFESVNDIVQRFDGPIILDSYCGVGESTANIAKVNPEALIIGVDKSLHRLQKHDTHYRHDDCNNYLLVRADLDDFWRQAVDAGWQLQQHYLLYPNPWPKSAHLKRRCHGSPLFPYLLELGGKLEVRSNWRLYIEEFCFALELAGHPSSVEHFHYSEPITPFERKYSAAKQDLWRCVASLD